MSDEQAIFIEQSADAEPKIGDLIEKQVPGGNPASGLESMMAPSTLAPQRPPPPPDGGFHAWATVAGSFLALFVQFGLANSFGILQTYYEANQLSNLSSSEISWIGGLQQFLLFFGGLFSGRIFDSHGAHILLLPGSLIFTTSLMLTSLCYNYYQFILCQGIFFGIGSSLVFHSSIAVPAQWFARRRALAMGIAVSGSGLGGTLWPIALSRMFNTIGKIFRFFSYFRSESLFLLTLSNLLIRTRLPRRKPAPWNASLQQLKDIPFVLFAFSIAFVFFGLYTPFFYVTTNAARIGTSSAITFYSLSFINAGSTIGRLLAGVGDYIGRMNLAIFSSLVSGILLLAFWIPLSTAPAIIGFSVVYGFFAGLYISLIPACIAQISHQHEIGLRLGLAWGIASIFALFGPPISGALISNYGGGAKGYEMAGMFSGVVVLAGTVFTVGSRFCLNKEVFAVM
ncbi:hypothetical protein J008_05326 [Cryptococcus neoformans]|nr:hypothetical protein J008_05326 [Cryptococcus neoformans var. grubii]